MAAATEIHPPFKVAGPAPRIHRRAKNSVRDFIANAASWLVQGLRIASHSTFRPTAILYAAEYAALELERARLSSGPIPPC